jgi:hypothetical protein
LDIRSLPGDPAQLGERIVVLAQDEKYDLIILSLPTEAMAPVPTQGGPTDFILRHAPCRVFLAAPPAIPQEPEK